MNSSRRDRITILRKQRSAANIEWFRLWHESVELNRRCMFHALAGVVEPERAQFHRDAYDDTRKVHNKIDAFADEMLVFRERLDTELSSLGAKEGPYSV